MGMCEWAYVLGVYGCVHVGMCGHVSGTLGSQSLFSPLFRL